MTELEWWEHSDFDHRYVLEAAELVAFDVLEPALWSRGAPQRQSRELFADDAFQRLTGVEKRVAELERLASQTG